MEMMTVMDNSVWCLRMSFPNSSMETMWPLPEVGYKTSVFVAAMIIMMSELLSDNGEVFYTNEE